MTVYKKADYSCDEGSKHNAMLKVDMETWAHAIVTLYCQAAGIPVRSKPSKGYLEAEGASGAIICTWPSRTTRNMFERIVM